MYRLQPQDYVSNRFVGLWGILAFQAGYLNSIGFLACHRFVSHVTGFGTQVGISVGQGNFIYAAELFSAPLAFVLGAWWNGYLTVARKAQGLAPRYDRVTLMMPLFILALMLAGVFGIFGPFGEPLILARDFGLLTSLSFLCGLQNACFATLTKGQIRTTHLTGISTDIGTDLALTLNGRLPEKDLQLAKRRNFMRFVTFIGFTFGAILSAVLSSQMHYWSLAVPFATASLVAGIFFKVKFEIDAIVTSEPKAA